MGVMGELAYFRLEGSAVSDGEIQTSIRRGMIGFPASRLVKISTPYIRSGVLWNDFQAAFGVDNPDLLVWRASSVLMNPSLDAERLERERRRDPSRYAREYEAEFAEDLEAFLPAVWVDEAVRPGRHELPPREGVHYVAAVDTSSGRHDAFTLAVCHIGGIETEKRVVQDVMRGWAPRAIEGQLEAVVKEIAETMKRYRLTTVTGDRYAVGFVKERFQAAGGTVSRERARQVGELPGGRAAVRARADRAPRPPAARAGAQAAGAAAAARGRTEVDHPRGSHDDYANSLALAAAEAAGKASAVVGGISGPTKVSL